MFIQKWNLYKHFGKSINSLQTNIRVKIYISSSTKPLHRQDYSDEMPGFWSRNNRTPVMKPPFLGLLGFFCRQVAPTTGCCDMSKTRLLQSELYGWSLLYEGFHSHGGTLIASNSWMVYMEPPIYKWMIWGYPHLWSPHQIWWEKTHGETVVGLQLVDLPSSIRLCGEVYIATRRKGRVAEMKQMWSPATYRYPDGY